MSSLATMNLEELARAAPPAKRSRAAAADADMQLEVGDGADGASASGGAGAADFFRGPFFGAVLGLRGPQGGEPLGKRPRLTWRHSSRRHRRLVCREDRSAVYFG